MGEAVKDGPTGRGEMLPAILFRRDRRDRDAEADFEACSRFFPTFERRAEIPPGSLVFGRYSVLPFYRELELDLADRGCRLVNTFEQHDWIASMGYARDLADLTFPTWTDADFWSCDWPGPFVVKGRTNSRKGKWDKLMFAPTKADAARLASRLLEEAHIAEQGIAYRKYEPLVTLETGLHGLPFANEWRAFCWRGRVLTVGFYWTQAEAAESQALSDEGRAFAEACARRAAPYADFYVLDVAEKAVGGWVLVEVNDAQQSGLSLNRPEALYAGLRDSLTQ